MAIPSSKAFCGFPLSVRSNPSKLLCRARSVCEDAVTHLKKAVSAATCLRCLGWSRLCIPGDPRAALSLIKTCYDDLFLIFVFARLSAPWGQRPNSTHTSVLQNRKFCAWYSKNLFTGGDEHSQWKAGHSLRILSVSFISLKFVLELHCEKREC